MPLLAAPLMAAPETFNSDESKVPPWTLPDPLVCQDGTKITTAEQWVNKGCPETLALFEDHVFGKSPPRPAPAWKLVEGPAPALAGKAVRRQFQVFFTGKQEGLAMDLLVYLPASSKGPVPVFFGLNFQGNQCVSKDPDIRLCTSWLRDSKESGIENNRATEASRGCQAERWPVEWIMDQGFGLATACYCDIDPDEHDEFRNGVHALFPEIEKTRGGSTWGSIAAWAWGMSCGLDCLVAQPEVDAAKVISIGHSRLGKTSLWAGATDTRFAMVVSNDSGCGGAAIERRWFGETVQRINTSFPHWFCLNHRKYNGNEAQRPVDNHQLIALTAPRPVLITSAQEDHWADPKGEFLGGLGADPVYRLLGTDGMAAKEWPAPSVLVDSRIGYQLRPGKHDVMMEDWQAYVKFARKHLTAGK